MSKVFPIAENAVPQEKIPFKTLNTGAKMPAIGMGTFGSDRFSAEQVSAAVEGAIHGGYRLLDCAACYGNEHLIGEVFKKVMDDGLPREDLFIMSKVWNDKHKPADVIEACKKTIEDLQVGYLDCYLVHWPFPNYHPPGCDADTRNPDSRPYIHEEFMETWGAMEQLVEMGLVKSIGTSNVTIPKLELILRDCKIKPAVNEMELHPCFQQHALYQYCLDHDIQPVGFCPIGSPTRPDRDTTPEDLSDIHQPILQEIAAAHNVHPAVICVKWAVQRGQIPIPFSVFENEYMSNLRCITEDPLTIHEIEKMKSVDRNNRLIKAPVFLWEGATDWLDLWDVDGTIPGWNGYANK